MGLISSYFNYKANMAQAAVDQQNAQLQYDAAMKQIEAQKEANAQQQEFNKQEAELAFQRNSSKGQLQQLIEAGLSEQQARQIIAGGSAGSYTAAPSVNQNQGVDYTAPAAAQAAQNQAATNAQLATQQFANDVVSNSTLGFVDQLYEGAKNFITQQGPAIAANVFGSSLTAADGGIIGNMSTAPLQGALLRHINEIPASARGSYAAFCSYASSAAAPAWCKTADFQNAMQLASSSPMAMKSMRNFFDTDNQLLTGDTYFQMLESDAQMKDANNKILSFQVDAVKAESLLRELEADAKINILPDQYNAILANWQRNFAEWSTQRDLWQNKDYKKAWIARTLLNEQDGAILAKVAKSMHAGQLSYLTDSDLDYSSKSVQFGIMSMLGDVGITASDIGSVAAVLIASGYDVPGSVKKFVDWITPSTNPENEQPYGKDAPVLSDQYFLNLLDPNGTMLKNPGDPHFGYQVMLPDVTKPFKKK